MPPLHFVIIFLCIVNAAGVGLKQMGNPMCETLGAVVACWCLADEPAIWYFVQDLFSVTVCESLKSVGRIKESKALQVTSMVTWEP